jgi:hypothetical protein
VCPQQLVDEFPATAFGTLPLNENGSPVSHALMTSAPDSSLRSALTTPPFCRPARTAAHSSIWRWQRRGYSSSGIA